MPKRYPREFRDDVVRVARQRPAGVTLDQIAADFGVSTSGLHRWMQIAAVDDGLKPGVSSDEQREAAALRRRVKLLEQENEVLRRAAAYLGQASLPKG